HGVRDLRGAGPGDAPAHARAAARAGDRRRARRARAGDGAPPDATRAPQGADGTPRGQPGRTEDVMAMSIVVPQLGESVAERTVAKWLKAVGDRVRKEEPLVEIQTDKINVEIPSPAEGTLQEILVPEGTTVLVGTEIGRLSGGGDAAPAPQAKSAP